jgi:hypothetical protein
MTISGITDTGRTLLGKRLAGQEVRFSKFTIGDGVYNNDAAAATALVNELFSIEVQNVYVEGGVMYFRGEFDNKTFNSDFYYREMGLWAIDPDTAAETLVAYVNYGDPADFIKSAADSGVTIQKLIELPLVVTNTQNITVNINNEVVAVTEKADIDLSNVTAVAKNLISGMGMPSSNYVNLTLGANGTTYTAPANGYFKLVRHNVVLNTAGNTAYVALINVTAENMSVEHRTQIGGNGMQRIYIPASKGDVIQINYDGSSTNTFQFIYAKGVQ